MDRDKLAKKIEEADLLPAVRDNLLRRLKVASHDGVASVVRDFSEAMEKRRIEVLPSYRRRIQASRMSPQNKQAFVFNAK